MTTETIRDMRDLLRRVSLPDAVLRLAGNRPVTPIWVNELGGITCSLGDQFVKWSPVGLTLRPEVERLNWVRPFVSVPQVVAYDHDAQGEWMVTTALPGLSAVDALWRNDPLTAIHAIGKGLRVFHDRVPVNSCPFDWSVATRGGDPSLAPPIDQLVVCHGDACSPNTLLSPDGQYVAHVDMGSMGVADRWADLAVASMSLDWNFEPAFETVFFEAYGIAPDPARIEYYRWLWEHGEDAHQSVG